EPEGRRGCGRPRDALGRAFSRNGTLWNMGSGLPHQSALMFAARITLPHFSVSSAMSLLKSAGEPASTVLPRSASCALIFASASVVLISLLSLSMISVGVLLGEPMPCQPLAS